MVISMNNFSRYGTKSKSIMLKSPHTPNWNKLLSNKYSTPDTAYSTNLAAMLYSPLLLTEHIRSNSQIASSMPSFLPSLTKPRFSWELLISNHVFKALQPTITSSNSIEALRQRKNNLRTQAQSTMLIG